MLFALEVFPLFLDVFVAFKFYVAFGLTVAGLDVAGYEVGEEQGVDAFALVFGLDGDEEQVDGVDFAAKGLEQVPPAEGEYASAALAQGVGETCHRYAYGHEFVVGVDDYRNVVEAEYAEVEVDVVVDLARGKGRVAV